jgi:hypothetical protein
LPSICAKSKRPEIRAGEPPRSLRLHFYFDPGFRYIIFGEEGYVDPNDIFEEFPSFGWKAARDQGNTPQGEQEGDEASEQGGEPQEGPKGDDVPANDDSAGSEHHKEPGGDDAQANDAQANDNTAGSARVACVSPSTLSTNSALISDWI